MSDDEINNYWINGKKVSKKEYYDFIKENPFFAIMDNVMNDLKINNKTGFETKINSVSTEPEMSDLEKEIIKYEEFFDEKNSLSYIMELINIKKNEIKASYDFDNGKLELKLKDFIKTYNIPIECLNKVKKPKMIYNNGILTINFEKQD